MQRIPRAREISVEGYQYEEPCRTRGRESMTIIEIRARLKQN